MGHEDEKARVLVCPLKDTEELKFSWNWVEKLKTFNNSPNKSIGPWKETYDRLDTYFWGYNLKQLGRMCPKIPQWWQKWCLTKDLELAISILDFIHLSFFSDWGTKTILDPEAVEEEGPKETVYPKPFLSKLGF